MIFMKNTPTYTAYIGEDSKGSALIVVDDLPNYNNEKNVKGYIIDGTIFSLPWYMKNREFKAGQQVKIYFDGKVRISQPAKASAYWVKILK